MHRTALIIVKCNIFFIAIFAPNILKISSAVLLFHQNEPDIYTFAQSFMSGVKKYKSKFTPDPDINLFGV